MTTRPPGQNAVTINPAAAAANNIAQSQSPVDTTPLTLNGSLVSGGVATLDVGRKVKLTTAADETLVTFDIVGTAPDGSAQEETLTGVNNTTVDTTKYWKTITSITPSGATTGAITFGTSDSVRAQIADNSYPWYLTSVAVLGTATASAPTVTDGMGGTVRFTIDTPASAAVPFQLLIPHPGIRFTDGLYVECEASKVGTLTFTYW